MTDFLIGVVAGAMLGTGGLLLGSVLRRRRRGRADQRLERLAATGKPFQPHVIGGVEGHRYRVDDIYPSPRIEMPTADADAVAEVVERAFDPEKVAQAVTGVYRRNPRRANHKPTDKPTER